jgi:glycerol-3-phosphate dehydrogenase
MRQVAVIGGGINGLCSAWALAKAGYAVTLYERDQIMRATSAASTKLLHGGLRYLEQGEFRLVREALRERAWWLSQVPEITQAIELVLPVYEDSLRGRWLLKLGLWLYDRLAGQHNIAPHRWCSSSELRRLAPTLKYQGLRGGFIFYDGQMDDYRLGLWVAEQARAAGVKILEQQAVKRIQPDGTVEIATDRLKYDSLVNVTGPWAVSLSPFFLVPTVCHIPRYLDVSYNRICIVQLDCDYETPQSLLTF